MALILAAIGDRAHPLETGRVGTAASLKLSGFGQSRDGNSTSAKRSSCPGGPPRKTGTPLGFRHNY